MLEQPDGDPKLLDMASPDERCDSACSSPPRHSRQQSGEPLEISLVSKDSLDSGRCMSLRNRRICRGVGLILLLLLIPCVIFICVAIARGAYRNRRLNPMLEDLENAHICYDATYGCCTVHLQNFDLTAAERALLGFMYAQVAKKDHDDIAEILCGAHTLVDDPNRTTYRTLAEFPGAYQRSSSHDSDDFQYGIDPGGILQTFLWGTIGDDLWFQLEADPWCQHEIICELFHDLDFVAYKILHHNAGPMGFSSHTDVFPLEAGQFWPHSRACPDICASGTNVDV